MERATSGDGPNRLGLQDNFSEFLGHSDLPKLPMDTVAWFLPLVWALVVVISRNLRLWMRTLLVGTFLVLMRGFLAWLTAVPSALGWEGCREELYPWALEYLSAETGPLGNLPMVLLLWLHDMAFFMRGQQHLVCAGGFSGSCALTALISLGLYDAVRSLLRSLGPWWRFLWQFITALLLTSLVLADAWFQLTARHQYTMDIVLALVLALLLYGSPDAALGTNTMLCWLLGINTGAARGRDAGDVLVPLCCVPFCCFHGRYFLYRQSASQVQETLRAEAQVRAAADDFGSRQEEAATYLLELEAKLDYSRQCANVRDRQDAIEVERQLQEQLDRAEKAHELRMAIALAKLEAARTRARGDFRAVPAGWWDTCYGLFSNNIDAAFASRTAGQLGDFRSAPVSFWDSCYKCFEYNFTATDMLACVDSSRGDAKVDAISATVKEVTACAAKASDSIFHGDFRSAPKDLWESCHQRFLARSSRMDSAGCMVDDAACFSDELRPPCEQPAQATRKQRRLLWLPSSWNNVQLRADRTS